MAENAPSGREKLGEQHEKLVFEFLRHNFSWVSAFGISVFEVFRFSFFGFLGFHILNFAFLSEKGELQVKTEQFQGRRDGVRSRNHAFQTYKHSSSETILGAFAYPFPRWLFFARLKMMDFGVVFMIFSQKCMFYPFRKGI